MTWVGGQVNSGIARWLGFRRQVEFDKREDRLSNAIGELIPRGDHSLQITSGRVAAVSCRQSETWEDAVALPWRFQWTRLLS